MKLLPISPAKALSKAYLKQSLKREQIELFKANLARMFERIRTDEHEEHLKNIASDFLKDTWYKQTNEINTSGRTDLVIHNGKSSSDTVGVLIEVKRPGNNNEMISPERPNAKALHELLHYYMQERYIKDNKEIRHLIVCNIHEWYIFDSVDFERFFFGNQKLVKSYKDWKEGTLPGMGTDWFYQEIAKPFIEKELDDLTCVYFNLKDFERIIRNPAKQEDGKLIALYKVLSPPHLLKQTFANDSNSLNKEFYSELLHILGLEEVKEKGKKLIRRKQEGCHNDGSLLENTCNFLKTRGRLSALSNLQQYGADADEQCFSVALELCITWLNRLLFLKLLEGQLIGYHKGDRSYAFLNSSRIGDFDELNELFFEVLAVRIDERSESVRTKFGTIPYLNSSLFEESDLERATMGINELKNRLDLPLHGATVLKASNGKRLIGSKSTLGYLFEFLDAYDFGAEGSADIQEQNKSIINASVLGLIFEKINGYKDGSFFTPGFITMYICRESIRRAVVRKFNDAYGWACHSITDLYNMLDKITIKKANDVVNSLKICDPAVGSGHFLVSALNEIIAIKSDLGILADSEGKRLRGYGVTIENDDLIVTADDNIFEYNFKDAESQRVQETFFHEKETIIENCLFGVDINPKSVAICRLRLWIELLKNAYYRRGSDQLETLPNIDINIKCGNSLVSRFALGNTPNLLAASQSKLKELTEKYRQRVFEYKLSPANKSLLRKVIADLKHDLENFGLPNDKDLVALRKKQNEVAQLGFAFDKKGSEVRQKLLAEVEVLQKSFAEKERVVYSNAFEWRFEFPEVLNEEGEFIGFDAIIGNPPYGVKFQKEELLYIAQHYPAANRVPDSYCFFMLRSFELLQKQGVLSLVVPNTFCDLESGETFRKTLLQEYNMKWIWQTGWAFEMAVVDTLVFQAVNAKSTIDSEITILSGDQPYTRKLSDFSSNRLAKIDYRNQPGKIDLINKIRKQSILLGDIANVKAGVKMYERGKGKPPQSEEIVESRPYSITGNCPDGWKSLYRGTDIIRYKLYPPSEFVDYGPWLAAPRSAEMFDSPKLLMRRTDDRLMCAIEQDSAICVNSCHVIKHKSDIVVRFPYEFLMAILNARLTQYFFELSNPQMQGKVFAEIKVVYVEQLPIPPATDAQQAPIVERVQKILAAPDSPDVPHLEAEIDRLVYALYGLTEEEIAVVEGTNKGITS
jgi:hypothetical protein